MKRYLVAAVGAAVLYGLFWVWQAYAARGEIRDWFAARQLDGWEASYADLTMRGFPSRLDATMSDVILADPDSGVVWEAPFLQMFALVYKPGHQIFAFADNQTVSARGQVWRIHSDALRASLVHEAEGRVLRANAEADVLNIGGADGALALADMVAGLEYLGGDAPRYRFGVQAQAVAGGAAAGGDLAISGEAVFDSVWDVATWHEARPQPRVIDVALAEYKVAGLELKLAGRVEIDDLGVPEGRIVLKAANWQDRLRLARDSGALPGAMADAVEQALTLLSGLKGNATTLDVPLELRGGRVWLGLIPIGAAPIVRLP